MQDRMAEFVIVKEPMKVCAQHIAIGANAAIKARAGFRGSLHQLKRLGNVCAFGLSHVYFVAAERCSLCLREDAAAERDLRFNLVSRFFRQESAGYGQEG